MTTESTATPVSLRDLVAGVRRWWWIVPVCWLVVVGLLFAQESRLQIEPASATTTRRYETGNPTAALVALGIDARAFYPTIGMGGVIERFNTADDDRRERTGIDATLTVSQGPADYSIVNQEIIERRTVYTVIGVGSNVLAFQCREASELNCGRALDLAVAEFSAAREDGLRTAIDDVVRVLEARLAAARAIPDGGGERSTAARRLEVELATQIEALRSTSMNLDYPLVMLNEQVTADSGTVTSVAASTYLLGLLLGTAVGALIIAQLSLTRARRARGAG